MTKLIDFIKDTIENPSKLKGYIKYAALGLLVAFVFSVFVYVAWHLTLGSAKFQNGWTRGLMNFENKPTIIKCYSGGTLIYDGVSVGKVTDDADSDGFFWRDREGLVEISADCKFRY